MDTFSALKEKFGDFMQQIKEKSREKRQVAMTISPKIVIFYHLSEEITDDLARQLLVFSDENGLEIPLVYPDTSLSYFIIN